MEFFPITLQNSPQTTPLKTQISTLSDQSTKRAIKIAHPQIVLKNLPSMKSHHEISMQNHKTIITDYSNTALEGTHDITQNLNAIHSIFSYSKTIQTPPLGQEYDAT